MHSKHMSLAILTRVENIQERDPSDATAADDSRVWTTFDSMRKPSTSMRRFLPAPSQPLELGISDKCERSAFVPLADLARPHSVLEIRPLE